MFLSLYTFREVTSVFSNARANVVQKEQRLQGKLTPACEFPSVCFRKSFFSKTKKTSVPSGTEETLNGRKRKSARTNGSPAPIQYPPFTRRLVLTVLHREGVYGHSVDGTSGGNTTLRVSCSSDGSWTQSSFRPIIFGSFSSFSNGVPSPTSAFIDGFRLLLLALNVSLTRSLRASYVLLDVHLFTVGSKFLSWQRCWSSP